MVASWRRSYFAPAGEPIRIGLIPTLPRPRNPTISNTPASVSDYHQDLFRLTSARPFLQGFHYRTRRRTRDGKCLIAGLQTQTYSRLQVAHIFPRTHDTEVSDLGVYSNFF